MLNRLRAQLMASLPPAIAVPGYAWKNRSSGEPELRWLQHVCAPELAAVDVGANVGIYSYWLCRLARECHAFEANPQLAARLTRFGQGRNLKVWPVALSDTAGQATLHIPMDPRTGLGRFGSASLVDHKDGPDFLQVQVDQVRLDSLDLPKIGFLKIDVEGFELNVLLGAGAKVEADRPNVLIEAEDRHRPHATRDVMAWFAERRYPGYYLHAGRWHPVSTFDVARHQQVANMAVRKDPATPYINNFLFVNDATHQRFQQAGFLAGTA